MFIEIHAIQNFAPSNLNRDDTGSPKDCEFRRPSPRSSVQPVLETGDPRVL